ncbi:hypothetical protein SETIT_2G184300v2 [Setaria italica]|uniref:Transcription repressor n=2 Tax=Setaria italica TaxID=4555 RepID=A0A368Q0K6_SETIT|nr:transcription repressor OFP11 [Setaria italica]RCV11422.1 hypothetical protein SETIT_2G184300v2 [Setaria italica]
MEKEEEDVDAMAEESAKQAAACKNRARLQLHKSFLHLSKALKKLHARHGGGHQANASGEGEPPTPSSSAAASFLSGCMHNPRTHSFASGRRHRPAHEDDDLGDALNVNFRSLRIGPSTGAAVAVDGGSSSPRDRYSSSDGASEECDDVAPPLPPTPAAAPANKAVFGGAGVAVVTFSAAPYEDFRRSMREMVDAASDRSSAAAATAGAPAVDWDFMEELLFCYLHLNDRAVHRDILRAFTDTVAALRRRRRTAKSRRTRRRGAAADSSEGGAVAPSFYVRGRGSA